MEIKVPGCDILVRELVSGVSLLAKKIIEISIIMMN